MTSFHRRFFSAIATSGGTSEPGCGSLIFSGDISLQCGTALFTEQDTRKRILQLLGRMSWMMPFLFLHSFRHFPLFLLDDGFMHRIVQFVGIVQNADLCKEAVPDHPKGRAYSNICMRYRSATSRNHPKDSAKNPLTEIADRLKNTAQRVTAGGVLHGILYDWQRFHLNIFKYFQTSKISKTPIDISA